MINNYNVGNNVITFSEDFNNFDFDNKIIYLTPFNVPTQEIFKYIMANYNPEKILFIDNYKVAGNIVKPDLVEEEAYIFLFSPNYHKEIAKLLPKQNLYFLYNDSRYRFFFKNYSSLNILMVNLFTTDFYFNLLNTIKYSLAQKSIYVTDNERKLATFKNKHKNKRAFIIGNGPSLTIDDLDMLKDEITFASNKIFLAFDETSWRPTYYSVEDSYDMNEYYDKVKDLDCSVKFLPVKHLLAYPKIKDAIYYPLIKNKSYDCSNNLIKGIYPGCSVSYTMLQIALYMGFSEIYFIGMDFSYKVPSMQSDNLILEHMDESNHFHKDYRKKGDKWLEPNEDCQLEALKSAKRFVDLNDIKIYNASRKTKLELFDKVNFDTLF